MSNVSIVYKNIEEYKGEMMVDFANKNLGGGVLKNGCVQEEILFVTHPELFMCCLLYNTLSDGECALVHGCYQYTKYEGYSGSFAYKGPIHEVPKIDCFSKHSNTFVVIDALNFN
jgi:poly(ADP-ribose) glycohydrolase